MKIETEIVIDIMKLSSDVDGVKVGVIGYITKDRGVYASYNIANITFTDEVEAVDATAKQLKEQGVDIIIAAGHAGGFINYAKH